MLNYLAPRAEGTLVSSRCRTLLKGLSRADALQLNREPPVPSYWAQARQVGSFSIQVSWHADFSTPFGL